MMIEIIFIIIIISLISWNSGIKSKKILKT